MKVEFKWTEQGIWNCKIPNVFFTATFTSRDYSRLIFSVSFSVSVYQKLEDGLKWSLQHLCCDVNDLQSLFLSSVSSFPLPTGLGH